MSITLSDGSTTVDLHPDLMWADEYAWNPVLQTADRSITGALVIMPAQMVGGRPITLQPEDDSSSWMTRETIDVLRNWAAGAGQVLQLTLRGTTRNVVFRHQEGVALEAHPVVHFSDMEPADFYLATLRFTEI